MSVPRDVVNQLRRFASAFRDARDRNANEADTVMFIVKFLEDVLGYDSLKGEVSKEFLIKDKYCDLALKVDGSVRVLAECKAAGIKQLLDKHIEQAENYASRSGIKWVVLTNGLEWRLYHLTFAEGEGIAHELAFEANFPEELEKDPEALWDKLSLLRRDAVAKDTLEEFWSKKKALCQGSVVRALFTQDVLLGIRRELNRNAPARLEVEDVFSAVRDVLSKEALLEAGDITIRKTRKRRYKARTSTDPQTGATVTEEVEEDSADEDEPQSGVAPDSKVSPL